VAGQRGNGAVQVGRSSGREAESGRVLGYRATLTVSRPTADMWVPVPG
jgi:hypothetical protein